MNSRQQTGEKAWRGGQEKDSKGYLTARGPNHRRTVWKGPLAQERAPRPSRHTWAQVSGAVGVREGARCAQPIGSWLASPNAQTRRCGRSPVCALAPCRSGLCRVNWPMQSFTALVLCTLGSCLSCLDGFKIMNNHVPHHQRRHPQPWHWRRQWTTARRPRAP